MSVQFRITFRTDILTAEVFRVERVGDCSIYALTAPMLSVVLTDMDDLQVFQKFWTHFKIGFRPRRLSFGLKQKRERNALCVADWHSACLKWASMMKPRCSPDHGMLTTETLSFISPNATDCTAIAGYGSIQWLFEIWKKNSIMLHPDNCG